MLQFLMLLLPGLIPSWQFFKTVEPSPRVQWRLLSDDGSGDWRDYQPRPQSLSVQAILRRLFWNPDWNDTLFMVSLSERLMDSPTPHSLREIQRRLEGEAAQDPSADRLQFQLVFVSRDGGELIQEITYLSAPWPHP